MSETTLTQGTDATTTDGAATLLRVAGPSAVEIAEATTATAAGVPGLPPAPPPVVDKYPMGALQRAPSAACTSSSPRCS